MNTFHHKQSRTIQEKNKILWSLLHQPGVLESVDSVILARSRNPSWITHEGLVLLVPPYLPNSLSLAPPHSDGFAYANYCPFLMGGWEILRSVSLTVTVNSTMKAKSPSSKQIDWWFPQGRLWKSCWPLDQWATLSTLFLLIQWCVRSCLWHGWSVSDNSLPSFRCHWMRNLIYQWFC